MKKLVGALALLLLVLPACTTEQRAASQNENQNRESAQRDREIYQDKVNAQLRDLDQKIDALKVKLENEKLNRKQINREMDELDRKRAAAQRQMDRLKSSSQDAWQDMKVGIQAAMRDLESAYDQAAAHFK